MNAQKTVKGSPLETGTQTPPRRAREAGGTVDGHRKCTTEVSVALPRLYGTCSSEPLAGGDAASRHWIHVGGERREAAGNWHRPQRGDGPWGAGGPRRGWLLGEGARPGRCGPRRTSDRALRRRCGSEGPALTRAPRGFVVGLFCPVTGLLSRFSGHEAIERGSREGPRFLSPQHCPH